MSQSNNTTKKFAALHTEEKRIITARAEQFGFVEKTILGICTRVWNDTTSASSRPKGRCDKESLY